MLPGLVTPQLSPQIPPGIPQVPGASPIPGALNPPPQLGGIPQINPGAQFPQANHGQGTQAHGQQHLGAGVQPTQTPSLPPQPTLPGQIPHQQVCCIFAKELLCDVNKGFIFVSIFASLLASTNKGETLGKSKLEGLIIQKNWCAN